MMKLNKLVKDVFFKCMKQYLLKIGEKLIEKDPEFVKENEEVYMILCEEFPQFKEVEFIQFLGFARWIQEAVDENIYVAFNMIEFFKGRKLFNNDADLTTQVMDYYTDILFIGLHEETLDMFDNLCANFGENI